VDKALSNLKKSQALLDQAGFEKVVYEDFYEAFANLIREVATTHSPEGIMSHTILLSAFQNPEGMLIRAKSESVDLCTFEL
jgi:ubiquitin thioesterase protein OTUB1